MIDPTHDDLVRRARQWLLGTMRCGVVLCEVAGGGLEQPDAIGWKGGGRHSILVEVKVSRSDFLKDRKKWHRQAGCGLGQVRWYFTPPGLVKPSEVPEGWGLAEAGKVVRKIVKPPRLQLYDSDVERRETGLMFSALRKVTLGIPLDRYGDWPREPWSKIQAKLGAWCDETFPEATESTILAHLKDEVEREVHEGCEPDELADAAILVMQVAHKRGLDLEALVLAKHQVNLKRKWGPPNDRGFREHVREGGDLLRVKIAFQEWEEVARGGRLDSRVASDAAKMRGPLGDESVVRLELWDPLGSPCTTTWSVEFKGGLVVAVRQVR